MNAEILPTIFVALMALAIVVYAILDGYDLGVGILLPMTPEQEPQRDILIASIGPFWDANETWLVLAVGLMLIAFPAAHSLILMNLYLPVVIMLIGLIMRGVAFDFRAKAAIAHKLAWDRLFKLGSLITTLTQGYMLGAYVTGFQSTTLSLAFCLLSAVGVSAAYCYIGGAWLVLKTEGELQQRAIAWTRTSGRFTALGLIAVSLVNLWLNPNVYDRWLQPPLLMFVLFIPATCILAFVANEVLLNRLPKPKDRHCGLPFLLVALIFVLSFSGLAFSFYPYIVPGELTIWEAASAPESLSFILIGAVIVIPVILLYTLYSYRVFHGKATQLRYY